MQVTIIEHQLEGFFQHIEKLKPHKDAYLYFCGLADRAIGFWSDELEVGKQLLHPVDGQLKPLKFYISQHSKIIAIGNTKLL